MPTALFYSGGQHQEMSLDRIFDMARSLAEKKHFSFKNPPWEEKKKLFLKLQLFFLTGDFLDVCWWRPLFPHRWLEPSWLPTPCFNLHWQKAKFRILGTLLQIFKLATISWPPKNPVTNWIALKSHFLQEPQKNFFISYPFDIRAQWCYLRALRTLTVFSGNVAT